PKILACRSGGMADAEDSKYSGLTPVEVRLLSPAPTFLATRLRVPNKRTSKYIALNRFNITSAMVGDTCHLGNQKKFRRIRMVVFRKYGLLLFAAITIPAGLAAQAKHPAAP